MQLLPRRKRMKNSNPTSFSTSSSTAKQWSYSRKLMMTRPSGRLKSKKTSTFRLTRRIKLLLIWISRLPRLILSFLTCNINSLNLNVSTARFKRDTWIKSANFSDKWRNTSGKEQPAYEMVLIKRSSKQSTRSKCNLRVCSQKTLLPIGSFNLLMNSQNQS